MKKITPGYYKDSAAMRLDGKLHNVTISVIRAETLETNWYSEIELNGTVIFEGSDWYQTKRECLNALTALLEKGAHKAEGLGWCANI